MYASYLNFKIIYWRTFQKVHFGCSPKSHITNILTEINYDIFLFFLPTFDIMPIFSFSLYLNSFLIYIYMWVRSGRPAFWYCHFLMNFKQMAELGFFSRKWASAPFHKIASTLIFLQNSFLLLQCEWMWLKRTPALSDVYLMIYCWIS